tara:strand:- start:74 stop:295 length:222 start_codon:yes stop_codon:yes gene_type:complete
MGDLLVVKVVHALTDAIGERVGELPPRSGRAHQLAAGSPDSVRTESNCDFVKCQDILFGLSRSAIPRVYAFSP